GRRPTGLQSKPGHRSRRSGITLQPRPRKLHMSTTSRLPRCFRLLLLLCGLAGTHGLRAQVQVTEEPGITRAIAQWKQYNLEHAEVRGWRVQISATTDRRQMETNKRLFERIYPDFPLVFVHNEPYY